MTSFSHIENIGYNPVFHLHTSNILLIQRIWKVNYKYENQFCILWICPQNKVDAYLTRPANFSKYRVSKNNFWSSYLYF